MRLYIEWLNLRENCQFDVINFRRFLTVHLLDCNLIYNLQFTTNQNLFEKNFTFRYTSERNE